MSENENIDSAMEGCSRIMVELITKYRLHVYPSPNNQQAKGFVISHPRDRRQHLRLTPLGNICNWDPHAKQMRMLHPIDADHDKKIELVLKIFNLEKIV